MIFFAAVFVTKRGGKPIVKKSRLFLAMSFSVEKILISKTTLSPLFFGNTPSAKLFADGVFFLFLYG